MKSFTVVWIGQMVSVLGTGMTSFALTIWIWQTTGEVTALALMSLCAFGPTVLISPLAGVLVDRWSRKGWMLASDAAAALASAAILGLLLGGRLELWNLYLLEVFTAVFAAFQIPAYGAAVTLMVDARHYARASGMLSLTRSTALVGSPFLAGALLSPIGIEGILVLDLVTFCVALATLAWVRIPAPPTSEDGRASRGSLRREMLFGWRYITTRSGLLGLLLIFFVFNAAFTLFMVLFPPLVLARTGNDGVILGIVQSALGAGGIAGGLLIALWGGPRQRVHGVLLGFVGTSLAGGLAFGLGRSLAVWVLGGCLAAACVPILNGCNQAIWQRKVPPDLQGRVFATRQLIAQISIPVALLAAGPVADRIFEPALRSGGAWSAVFESLVGDGPGAGFALMFLLAGLLGTLAGLSGYLFRSVRRLEDSLPDHPAETSGRGSP